MRARTVDANTPPRSTLTCMSQTDRQTHTHTEGSTDRHALPFPYPTIVYTRVTSVHMSMTTRRPHLQSTGIGNLVLSPHCLVPQEGVGPFKRSKLHRAINARAKKRWYTASVQSLYVTLSYRLCEGLGHGGSLEPTLGLHLCLYSVKGVAHEHASSTVHDACA